MSGEGEKAGLAAAVAICLDEQEALLDEAERETMSDLFGEVVPARGPGRPAGAVNRATALQVEAIRRSGQSPLAFLASVYRDREVAIGHRIQAAIAAAPYVHRKQPVDLNISQEPFTLILGDGAGEAEAAVEPDVNVLDGDFEDVTETPTETEG